MPVPNMAELALNHQRRFQAAVDVIHNLPKNGCYRPSYEVMLRFYGLYKQAVCGPCKLPRPSFWDPVGRYKWDAWSQLGQMSSESAMAAYVDEMKNVAQEVIDTMPMDEKTASLFHHFEPLYCVIHDMPRPPESLLLLQEGFRGCMGNDRAVNGEAPAADSGAVNLIDRVPHDSGIAEASVLTSDSENELFCDSVDTVEQLELKVPVLNGFHKSHMSVQGPLGERGDGRQAGAGQGGEGAGNGKGPIKNRDSGREASQWRERKLTNRFKHTLYFLLTPCESIIKHFKAQVPRVQPSLTTTGYFPVNRESLLKQLININCPKADYDLITKGQTRALGHHL